MGTLQQVDYRSLLAITRNHLLRVRFGLFERLKLDVEGLNTGGVCIASA